MERVYRHFTKESNLCKQQNWEPLLKDGTDFVVYLFQHCKSQRKDEGMIMKDSV